LLQWVSDFADQAVILPVTVTVGLVLCLERRWREAAPWFIAIACVLGAVAVLKIVCAACTWLWPALGADALAIRSPSGHAASAAVLCGSVGGLLGERWRMGASRSALIGAAAAGSSVGLTRVLLGVHSPAEVVLGLALGLAGALAFALMLGQPAGARLPNRALAAALVVIAVQHGHHLAAEQELQGHWPIVLRSWMAACVPN
jgi:membrane-associated phospholipid phosphatase